MTDSRFASLANDAWLMHVDARYFSRLVHDTILINAAINAHADRVATRIHTMPGWLRNLDQLPVCERAQPIQNR